MAYPLLLNLEKNIGDSVIENISESMYSDDYELALNCIKLLDKLPL